jgi:hypothetical protein
MASYYAEQFAGDNYFGQSGTNIPSFGVQGGYAGGSSTDTPPYLGSYLANAPAPGMGASPLQPFSRDLINKSSLPVTQPPKNFLDNYLPKIQNQQKTNQASIPSFDLVPDIDSPITDKWLQDYRSTPGYTKPVMPTPEEFQQRVRQLRSSLRPV